MGLSSGFKPQYLGLRRIITNLTKADGTIYVQVSILNIYISYLDWFEGRLFLCPFLQGKINLCTGRCLFIHLR